jgi:hypothetical protein
MSKVVSDPVPGGLWKNKNPIPQDGVLSCPD